MRSGAMLEEILAELDRATKKFPNWPDDPFVALAVLQEEVGELTKAVLQCTWEPSRGVTEVDIRAEAVQVAAMTIRFIAGLDRYVYSCCTQHVQKSGLDAIMADIAGKRAAIKPPQEEPAPASSGWQPPPLRPKPRDYVLEPEPSKYFTHDPRAGWLRTELEQAAADVAKWSPGMRKE